MKNITLLLISLTCCLYSFSQQKALSNIVDISIPKGSELLSEEQFSSYAKQENFKYSALLGVVQPHSYALAGLLISFWDVNLANDKRTLEEVKRQLLWGFTLTKTFTVNEASIRTLNNHPFLIFDYTDSDINYYRYYTETIAGQALNGVIQYQKADSQKATNVLNTMLKSIKFKK